MCGIAGLIAFDQNNERPERQTIAREMGETLNHRGPNGRANGPTATVCSPIEGWR